MHPSFKPAAATAAAFALALCAAAPAQSAELIQNGDFSAGLSNWLVSGQVSAATAAAYGPCCGVIGSEPAYTSNIFAALGGGNIAGGHSLSQSFATVVGSIYNLTFDAGAFGNGVNVLIASLGGVTNSYTLTANNNADTTFGSYGFAFTGTGADTVTFAVNTGADGVDAILDTVSVLGAAVPEPASWALMIMGFGGVGGMLRARRRLVLAPVTA